MRVMEAEVEGVKTSLLAYLLELTSMMAICDENQVAKDLYTAMYRNPLPLKLIRQSDTQKAKLVFSDYCSDWEDDDFAMTENGEKRILQTYKNRIGRICRRDLQLTAI